MKMQFLSVVFFWNNKPLEYLNFVFDVPSVLAAFNSIITVSLSTIVLPISPSCTPALASVWRLSV